MLMNRYRRPAGNLYCILDKTASLFIYAITVNLFHRLVSCLARDCLRSMMRGTVLLFIKYGTGFETHTLKNHVSLNFDMQPCICKTNLSLSNK